MHQPTQDDLIMIKENLDMSNAELARAVGASTTQVVARWVEGETSPSPRFWPSINKLLLRLNTKAQKIEEQEASVFKEEQASTNTEINWSTIGQAAYLVALMSQNERYALGKLTGFITE